MIKLIIIALNMFLAQALTNIRKLSRFDGFISKRKKI